MKAGNPRHYLSVSDLSREELGQLLVRAAEIKRLLHAGDRPALFHGRVLAMVFEKSVRRFWSRNLFCAFFCVSVIAWQRTTPPLS